MKTVLWGTMLAMVAYPAAAEEAVESAVSNFTLTNVQLVAAPEFGQAKLTGLGTIGPAGFPLGFTWIVQGGFALPFADGDAPAAWTLAEGGVEIAITPGAQFSMYHRVRAGIYADMIGRNPDPVFAYVNCGQAGGQAVSWVSINEWSINNDGSVFYYYEGLVDASPFPGREIRFGGFWENRRGFQAGPRVKARDFYVHVGVVGTPMVFVGIEHVW
ncbi:MAG: hypothetical protein ABIG66_05655 [Candidatus Kerfeldbacteria bacterium]